MYRWTIPTSEGGISISASGGPEREGRFSGSGSNRSLIPSGTNPPDRSVRPSTLAFNMICEDGAEDDAPADPSPLPSGVVRLRGGGNSALAVAAGAATGAVLFVSALRVAVLAWRSFVKCAARAVAAWGCSHDATWTRALLLSAWTALFAPFTTVPPRAPRLSSYHPTLLCLSPINGRPRSAISPGIITSKRF